MFGKTKSKSPTVQGPLHPVLASAQDSVSGEDFKLTTLTEKELQEKIRENKKKQEDKKRIVRKMEKDQTFSPVQGIAGFFIALGLGWWALKQLELGSEAIDLKQYKIARGVLFVSIYVMVLIIAFRMSFPTGFMCLIFPPAILYFIVIPMESSALKGLIAGFAVVAFMEVQHLGEDSSYAIGKKNYTALAAKGRNLLNAGSDDKYYK